MQYFCWKPLWLIHISTFQWVTCTKFYVNITLCIFINELFSWRICRRLMAPAFPEHLQEKAQWGSHHTLHNKQVLGDLKKLSIPSFVVTDINNKILHIYYCLKQLNTWRINSLLPSEAKWFNRYESSMAQVMVCCLTAPSHYLSQCWFIIDEVVWHSSNNRKCTKF